MEETTDVDSIESIEELKSDPLKVASPLPVFNGHKPMLNLEHVRYMRSLYMLQQNIHNPNCVLFSYI